MTSRNLDSRPAGAKPVRPGASPPGSVASLAPRAPRTGRAMRRCAKVWAVRSAASKISLFRNAQGFCRPEGRGGAPEQGQGQPQPAGCGNTARSKRTTQEPGRPLTFRREDRKRVTGNRPRQARLGLSRRELANNKLRRSGRAACRDNRREARRSRGVGGLNSSGEVGERGHPDPAERRQAV